MSKHRANSHVRVKTVIGGALAAGALLFAAPAATVLAAPPTHGGGTPGGPDSGGSGGTHAGHRNPCPHLPGHPIGKILHIFYHGR
ncbi:hypothetical protein [Mycolicibacterium sp. P1-5]|uniref:hypothetical protein n=1 Tax=Mycolicibacterium sp. P1-5 TaxID=2024617 RepID=UPI0011EEC478|nr:hypothetical protein [Mycolicibacterium sp. P1-5]